MADLKISQLTGATTPLTGTEELPLVQSSSTKKVTVGNLTAGRSVAMLSNTINANTVVPSAGSITGTNMWAIGADATVNTLLMDAFGSNNFLAFRRASGTAAAPTAVVNGNSIINIGARGYGTTTYSSGNRSSINISAAETWTDTAQGTRMILNTTPVGTTTLTEGLKIDPNSDVTVSNGNLIVGIAAKGVNFTANTPAAGMTSRLLNAYEEGTWTPIDSSGASLTFTDVEGTYTKVGRLVTCFFTFVFPSTASVLPARIGGLPFTFPTGTNGLNAGSFNVNTSSLNIQPFVLNSTTTFSAIQVYSGSSSTNAQLTTATLRGSITYSV